MYLCSEGIGSLFGLNGIFEFVSSFLFGLFAGSIENFICFGIGSSSAFFRLGDESFRSFGSFFFESFCFFFCIFDLFAGISLGIFGEIGHPAAEHISCNVLDGLILEFADFGFQFSDLITEASFRSAEFEQFGFLLSISGLEIRNLFTFCGDFVILGIEGLIQVFDFDFGIFGLGFLVSEFGFLEFQLRTEFIGFHTHGTDFAFQFHNFLLVFFELTGIGTGSFNFLQLFFYFFDIGLSGIFFCFKSFGEFGSFFGSFAEFPFKFGSFFFSGLHFFLGFALGLGSTAFGIFFAAFIILNQLVLFCLLGFAEFFIFVFQIIIFFLKLVNISQNRFFFKTAADFGRFEDTGWDGHNNNSLSLQKKLLHILL